MAVSKEQEDALRLHNAELQDDSRPPLKWDPALAAEAEAYAKLLAKRDRNLVHANKKRHGENLYCGWGDGIHVFEFSLAMAARAWIDERKIYKGQRIGEMQREGQIGHYTQIIWQQCTRVGMGKAMSATKKFYIVARYNAMQIYGQVPYSAWKGNIFVNRKWQEMKGHEIPASVRLDRRTIREGEKLPPGPAKFGRKEGAKQEKNWSKKRKGEENKRKEMTAELEIRVRELRKRIGGWFA